MSTAVGKARIFLHHNELMAPFRIDENITFPKGTKFKFLKGREQIMATRKVGNEKRYYFAGTDEQPFMTQMEPNAFMEVDMVGEAEFYESLVPKHIKYLSEVWEVPWRRQGDIFGLPMPDWMKLRVKHKSPWYTRNNEILQTRHTASHVGETGSYQCVRGVIKAPDHKPQRWGGWHVVGQTRFLKNPRKAD